MRKPIPIAAAIAALLSGSLPAAPISFQGYRFEATVQKADGLRYRESTEKGRLTLKVRPDEEYSIVVRNPLPVRAAVAVSIDGLNSIDGQRSSPRKARKWMIEPHGSVTISGWQTSSSTLRKFVFTKPEAAYAQWREGKEGKPYAKNMGVIGVAWFWNREELDAVLNPPKPFEDEVTTMTKSSMGRAKSADAPAAASPERAGTGMGREQSHAVTQVAFNANAGMFAVKDVLKIFYEFAQDPPEPLPFVSEDEDTLRFAPEMGK